LDARTSRGITGNLDDHLKYQAAQAMGAEGSAAGQAMGMGMGAGIGMQMGNMFNQNQAAPGPWGQVPQQPAAMAPPPPPPPPAEHLWHIAVAGNVTGPFSKAAMGRKVTDGTVSRDTMVWTQGQDGWIRAEDVGDLNAIFTVAPPPPPGA
jgi:hypothetical protein